MLRRRARKHASRVANHRPNNCRLMQVWICVCGTVRLGLRLAPIYTAMSGSNRGHPTCLVLAPSQMTTTFGRNDFQCAKSNINSRIQVRYYA